MYEPEILCCAVLNEQQSILITRSVSRRIIEKEKCHEDVKLFFEKLVWRYETNFIEDWDRKSLEDHDENPFFTALRASNQVFVLLNEDQREFISRIKYDFAIQNYISYNSMCEVFRLLSEFSEQIESRLNTFPLFLTNVCIHS